MKYPNQSTYTEGSSIILLTCISNGNPLPTYSWYFNGTFVNVGSVLEIMDGRESENGFYICDASNSFNGQKFEASKSVYIHIISKYIIVSANIICFCTSIGSISAILLCCFCKYICTYVAEFAKKTIV